MKQPSSCRRSCVQVHGIPLRNFSFNGSTGSLQFVSLRDAKRAHVPPHPYPLTLTLALVLTFTLTVLLRCLVLTRPPAPRPHPPSPGPSTDSSRARRCHGHTPPQVACPHPPRRRPHHDLPQARREAHSSRRTHATHHRGCGAACSRRGPRSGPCGHGRRLSPLQCSGFPSLGPRGEPPRRFRCQGEGYNGALTHPKSRASSPAVDYPQVAAELIDAAAKAAATETSTEVAAEALDILRPGSGLGPVALHQTQAHAPTGEAEGRGKGEGGGQGRGVAPAEEAGGEEQELHGGDEGENEGEEDEDDDDIELEEHELAKALPRAGRGGDGWPIAGLTHLPHRPVLAVAEIVEAGGWLTTQRTPTESPRSARPAHRAIQPAQL